MIPLVLREVYEEQAAACLEAASRHQPLLLAVARKLAGNDEGGRELFQEAVLNCHDAIQSKGFAGGRYEFYILKAIRNQQRKEKRQQQKHPTQPLGTDEGHLPAEPEPLTGALGQLAEHMMAEARAHFSPAERLILRLSLDGYSNQQIAVLVGLQDRTWIWRRLEKMKAHLRHTFQQAWDALGE